MIAFTKQQRGVSILLAIGVLLLVAGLSSYAFYVVDQNKKLILLQELNAKLRLVGSDKER